MTDTEVKERQFQNGIRFQITGRGDVLGAIHRMVPAHSKQLNLLEIFTINTETNITGVTMTVTVKRESGKSKL